jgi:crotonobetainyl-CoA:carnitine CoA-transferase CaiB-like acyl-CoA transferase
MGGPLQGMRVLDLSRVLAGPWVGQNLADLGAEVIKIEAPATGDDTRGWGPPFVKDTEGRDTRESAYFLAANRGKKSVAVNLQTENGCAIVRQMVTKCNILIENFKVGGLKKYGLDYSSLKAANPELIYCSITGFGQDGPFAHHPGYDLMIQGMGGLMDITGDPAGPPTKVGVAVVDLMSGMYATSAILAAICHWQNTRRGQHIDISLLDCQMAMLANQALNYLVSGKSPTRMGNGHPNLVPYQPLPAADGYFILAVGNDRQFADFCRVAELEHLAEDTRYATNAGRVIHREDLIKHIEVATRRRGRAAWISLLEEVKVPCGPINQVDEAFDHPQVKHRNLRIELKHPVTGVVPSVANPMRFSDTPIEYGIAPPMCGQDTYEVLGSLLGYDDARLAELKNQGAIGDSGQQEPQLIKSAIASVSL